MPPVAVPVAHGDRFLLAEGVAVAPAVARDRHADRVGPGRLRNPLPGEPAFVSDLDNDESHALISHMPGIYGHGELLYFSGNQISSVMAAVQAFIDPTLARTLVSKLTTKSGFPRYYQVVLKVKSMDSMPIEISYMFHRDLSSLKVQASAGKP